MIISQSSLTWPLFSVEDIPPMTEAKVFVFFNIITRNKQTLYFGRKYYLLRISDIFIFLFFYDDQLHKQKNYYYIIILTKKYNK